MNSAASALCSPACRTCPGSGPSSAPWRFIWRSSCSRRPGQLGCPDDRPRLLRLHRARRHRADVRHHARARQYRPLAAGDHRLWQRRRHEGDGGCRFADCARAGGRNRRRAVDRDGELPADPAAQDPAADRHTLLELRDPLHRDQLWARIADRPAARLRDVHERAHRRHFRAGRAGPAALGPGRRGPGAHGLWALGARGRAEHAGGPAGWRFGRARADDHLYALRRAGGPVRRVSGRIHGRLLARCRRGIPSHARSRSW